jgi:hypothetical protein
MKELLLTLILYVIQNNTNTKIIFNTYEEYELRIKEEDKGVDRQGIIYVKHLKYGLNRGIFE